MSAAPRPNHFATALAAMLQSTGKRLVDISEASGIPTGDLSKIRAGKKKVTHHVVTHLANALPGEDGDSLLVAFFKDLLPPGRDTIRIESTRSENTRTKTASAKGRKLSDFDEAIRVLSLLGNYPHMSRHIISLADTARWLTEKAAPSG